MCWWDWTMSCSPGNSTVHCNKTWVKLMLVSIRNRLEVLSSFIYFPLYQGKSFDSILSKQDCKSLGNCFYHITQQDGLGFWQTERTNRNFKKRKVGGCWWYLNNNGYCAGQRYQRALLPAGGHLRQHAGHQASPPTGSSTRRRETLLPDNLCLHEHGGWGLGLIGSWRNHWLWYWEDSEYWESSVFKAAKVKFRGLFWVWVGSC